MKILNQTGNYISGTRIVQLNDGTIEKHSLHLTVDRNPTYTITETWGSYDSYSCSLKPASFNLNKAMEMIEKEFGRKA